MNASFSNYACFFLSFNVLHFPFLCRAYIVHKRKLYKSLSMLYMSCLKYNSKLQSLLETESSSDKIGSSVQNLWKYISTVVEFCRNIWFKNNDKDNGIMQWQENLYYQLVWLYCHCYFVLGTLSVVKVSLGVEGSGGDWKQKNFDAILLTSTF